VFCPSAYPKDVQFKASDIAPLYNLLVERNFAEAESWSENFSQSFPPRKEAAYTLLALHATRRKKKNLLKRVLGKMQEPYPGLDDIYLYLKGDFFFDGKDYEKSRKFLYRLVKKYPSSIFADRSLLLIGRGLFLEKKYRKAIKELKHFIKLFPKSRLQSDALWFLARSRDSIGFTSKAVANYRQVVWNHPLSPYARSAYKKLNKKKRGLANEKGPNQLYKRAIQFYKFKRYRSAERDLHRLCKKYTKHPKIPHAILIRGKIAFNLRKNRKALRLFSWLIRAFPRANEAAEALFTKSMIYWRMDREKDFIKTCKKVKKKYPKKWGARVLYTIGKYYEEKKEFGKALEQYEAVVRNFPPQKYFHESLWSASWTLFLMGDLKKSEKKMALIEKGYPDSPHRSDALFWRAAILEKLGEKKKELELHVLNVKEFPLTFLGHESRLHLKQHNVQIPYEEKGLGKEAVEVIYLNIFIPKKEKEHVRFLLSNCLFKIAERILKKNTRGIPRKKRYKTLFELAKIMYSSGNYVGSINILRGYFIDKMLGVDRDCPEGFWRMSYPMGFYTELEKNARKYKLSPYLIASITRAESAFNPDAVSRTQAMGLMQVQPKTGKLLARKMGITGFRREHLSKPETNIAIGSFYLKKLLKEFDGNSIYAIASYNAGEEKVHKWAKKNGHLNPIEFINTIPYRETRTYVKRVLGYIEEYKRIYE